MKREDFKIEGIPEGYRVYDVDLSPQGRVAAILGSRGEIPAVARVDGMSVRLPERFMRRCADGSVVCWAHSRWAGDDRIVTTLRRVQSNDDISAWVWTSTGDLVAEFHAGDDVEEVLANDEFILFFYGDEGQTGDIRLSHQAMAVVSTAGEYLWGHESQFRKDSFDVWFHAAVWEGRDQVAVFADVRHRCAFVRLNVRTRRQQVWRPPEAIATPTAVTSIGTRVILHGLGAPPREEIVAWQPGDANWEMIGEWVGPPLRGLPGGRFIAVQPDGYTILSFD